MSEDVAIFPLVSTTPEQSVAEPVFILGHRPELDGLRGVAILMVLFLHLGFGFIPGGFLGVDIFFVLSGFLITSLLIQEQQRHGRIRLKAFYVRRALRLAPALLFYLTVLALVAMAFMKRERAIEVYQGILLTLSYVSNWVFALNPKIKIGPLGITWSLAIEEQFYLVWPLMLCLAVKFKVSRRAFLYTLVLVIVSVALHRMILVGAAAKTPRLYYATDTRADALLTGCLVALLLSWTLISRTKIFRQAVTSIALAGFFFVVCLAGTSSMGDKNLYLGFLTLVSLAIGAILIVLMLWPPAWALRILRARPLTWIGRISYGVYLWHWPIREIICPNIESAPIGRVAATAIISVGAAALSFYLVERPFLRLKERFARLESGNVDANRRERLIANSETIQAPAQPARLSIAS